MKTLFKPSAAQLTRPVTMTDRTIVIVIRVIVVNCMIRSINDIQTLPERLCFHLCICYCSVVIVSFSALNRLTVVHVPAMVVHDLFSGYLCYLIATMHNISLHR